MSSLPPRPSGPADGRDVLTAIARDLVRVEGRLVDLEKQMRPAIDRVAPDRRESAKNLVHYVALRQHDLRDLQIQLSRRGLSSLGRSESCVMSSVLEVSERAHESLALHGDGGAQETLTRLEASRAAAMSSETAKDYLHRHTHAVLGPRPGDRHIYIMVTAPPAKEADRTWMVTLLRAGMNVLRINCAHEGEREWAQMARTLDKARRDTGMECRLLMDLAGPKIRTGPIAGGRRIATWKPGKDELGRITASARVVIRRASASPGEGVFLRLSDDAFAKVRKGDELRLRDARGKKRSLVVSEVGDDEAVGLSSQRAYVLDRARSRVCRAGKRVGDVTLEVGNVMEAAMDVRMGDALVLTRRAVTGKPPKRDGKGRDQPGVIACTLPDALDHLEVGHRVFFDDGRIQAVVEHAKKARGDYRLRIVRTQKETAKLRAEKGINLPDTRTTVSSLTDEDLRTLVFVAKHADAVSLSFVRTPEDVRVLHENLDRLGRPGIAVILKIETRTGFENLPRLLLEGLRRPPLAVMIARGDLACRGWIRAPGGAPRGDLVALRSEPRSGDLGHAGARYACADRSALSRGGHRRRRGRRGGVRHAQQGPLRRRGRRGPVRYFAQNGEAPLQKA